MTSTTKNIYLIVGPSGVGKTSLVNELEHLFGLKSIESYTTRPKRTEDETGHVFISDEEFDELRNLCAYTEYNGHRYGVTRAMIDESELYVVDPKGVRFFLSHYYGEKKPYIIGVTADKMTRLRRMIKRGDAAWEANDRLVEDSKQFREYEKLCNTIIVNDDFNATVLQLWKIILAEEAKKENNCKLVFGNNLRCYEVKGLD